MQIAPSNDAALVQRAVGGDAEAYEHLYREHVGRVFGLCLRMTRGRNEAEELVQDVFVRVWERLGSFRGDAAFSTWLHRVSVNVVIERMRSNGRWRDRFSADTDLGEIADMGFAAMAGADVDLERAIATLPEKARMVFVLHDVEGYKHREIASMSGLAVGTCKAHLHRARALLRKRLDDEPKEGNR